MMAVLMMLELPGATPDQYDRANEILGIAGDADAPEGLISHAAGLTDEGMVIVDVWDSAESLERFFEEREVQAAMNEAGAELGEPRVLPVHNQFEGGGSEPAVLMIAELDDLDTGTYDQMASGMEGHGTAAHPSVHHAAAVTDGGGMVIVDIWESPEAFGKFAQEQIAPAGEEAGMTPFEPRFVPVHRRIKGQSA
jgi:heme-degrading monooxygenase HmoA